MLLAGGVPQSYVDLDDPRHLELEYMRRLGHLLDLAAPAGTPLRVLHLGGGGLTLARYVAATRPGSRQVAGEADAEVVRLVRRRLPLDQRGPRRPAGSRCGWPMPARCWSRSRPARSTWWSRTCSSAARTPAAPDVGRVRRGRGPGAGPVGALRGQHRRRPAAGPRPRPGGHGAVGVPARLRDRRGGGAARPQVRQPGGRRGRPGAARRPG